MAVTGSTFASSTANNGAAIWSEHTNSNLDVTQSTFANLTAADGGGWAAFVCTLVVWVVVESSLWFYISAGGLAGTVFIFPLAPLDSGTSVPLHTRGYLRVWHGRGDDLRLSLLRNVERVRWCFDVSPLV